MPFSIDIHLGPDDLDAGLRTDALIGLSSRPYALAPKWFYDDLGSKLFDAITELDEYYPTRREREILVDRATDIARVAGGVGTLVELGAGTSTKTRILLDALGAGTPSGVRRFVPLDVSEATLRDAGAALAGTYPGLHVHAVVGDFERHLMKLPTGDRRLVAFLGGTIGNLEPSARARLLEDLGGALEKDELLLLGTDLVKAAPRLVAAYDDAVGVTAAFNRNILRVLNRRLSADFDARRFVHEARWDPDAGWMEMHLRSTERQLVSIRELDLVVPMDEGETIRTEISAKFRRQGIEAELAAAGFHLVDWWTDRDGDFALSLSARA